MSNLLTFVFLLYILNTRIFKLDTALLNLGLKNSVVLIFQTSLDLLWILLDTSETCWLYVKIFFSQPRFLIGWWVNYIFPANLLYLIALFGSFYLVLVNLLLELCTNAQVKTTVLCMSLWFVYVVLRNQVSKIRAYAANLDRDLFYKHNVILALPLILWCFTQQICVLMMFDYLETAECAKRTPVMNEVISLLSKPTSETDIAALVLVHNRAEDLNYELNEFDRIRDHPGDMTKKEYVRAWNALCKRNAFAESHTFDNDPRSFIAQEHHSLKIAKDSGNDTLERYNIVGKYHNKAKLPGDFMQTQEKLNYQRLGGTLTILSIDELKKTAASNMSDLTVAAASNATTYNTLPADAPYSLHITLQRSKDLSDAVMKDLPVGSEVSREQAMVDRMTTDFNRAGIYHPVKVDCYRDTNKYEVENVVEVFRKRRAEAESSSYASKPLAEPLAKFWVGTKHRQGEFENLGGALGHNNTTIIKPVLPKTECLGLKVTLSQNLKDLLKTCVKCTPK